MEEMQKASHQLLAFAFVTTANDKLRFTAYKSEPYSAWYYARKE